MERAIEQAHRSLRLTPVHQTGLGQEPSSRLGQHATERRPAGQNPAPRGGQHVLEFVWETVHCRDHSTTAWFELKTEIHSMIPPDLAMLAARIPDGAKLVVPPDYSGVAVAATLALIARGVRALHLVCAPTSGLQADLLIGAGAVHTIETSAVSLGEFGAAPRFVEAVRAGALRVLDATCPAIHAGLQAAQKGLPFMPLTGLLESDLLTVRPDWRVIENPFPPHERLVALPAIRPDVALFHAPLADRHGNVWIGRRRELVTMAQASRHTFVTVEAIGEDDLLANERTAAGTISSLYVDAIAPVPNGAWPIGLWDHSPPDTQALSNYASAARTADGFTRILADWSRRGTAT